MARNTDTFLFQKKEGAALVKRADEAASAKKESASKTKGKG
jgi:hypothetical protein